MSDPWVRKRKFDAVREAEAAGQIADSMDVRISIVNRIHSGELTLEAGQKLLAKIKREAKSAGKITRNQAFTRG